MLKINNLHVSLDDEDKQILKGVDLNVDAGKVHAIMGPNGSGKSTLSYVLSGKDGYNVTNGTVELNGDDILDLEPEERASLGLFLHELFQRLHLNPLLLIFAYLHRPKKRVNY